MIDQRILDKSPWGTHTEFVVLAEAGSNAHGTVLGSDDKNHVDDVDYLGAYWPPASHIVGLDRRESWVEQFDELDITTYSFEKLIRLLAKANPNVMGLLWMPDNKIVHRSDDFDMLVKNRDLFVAKRPVYGAFVGYARDQMKKMTSGQKYEGYMGEKRRKMVDTFGYDTKNAAHLIRLLTMAIEFLQEGAFIIDRTGIDADKIKCIKRGQFPLRVIERWASELFAEAEAAYRVSSLPEDMDREVVNRLLVDMQLNHLVRKAGQW